MDLSSRQIQDKEFPTTGRGYNRAAVDTFMNECANLTSALEERTRIAEVRAASSERELAAQRANIDALLQDATDARRKIIDEAKAEANSIRSQAEQEARATQASLEAQLAEVRRLLRDAHASETDSEVVIDLRDRADQPQGSQVSP